MKSKKPRHEAYNAIEDSMMAAVRASMETRARTMIDGVKKALLAGDFVAAHRHVNDFTLAPAIKASRGRFLSLGLSALLFGASRTKAVRDVSHVKAGKMPAIVALAVNQMSNSLQHKATLRIKAGALMLIADAEEKATKHVALHKYDESQPRADNGQWTAGTEFSSLKNMPSHIEGVPITKKPLGGSMLAIGGTSGITVSTSKAASAAWKDKTAYQKKAYEAGWSSSPHPNHTLWHELGHVLFKRSSGVDADSRATNTKPLFDPHFKAVSEKVSKYASTNGHEFIAEVFAGHRAGRTFDADVLAKYKDLKGPPL